MALIAFAMVGCSPSTPTMNAGHGPIVLPCEDDYRAAVIVHERDHLVSAFDPAIATCHTFADWTHAVTTNPAALGADAMAFLRDRCRQAPMLAKAVLCTPINR